MANLVKFVYAAAVVLCLAGAVLCESDSNVQGVHFFVTLEMLHWQSTITNLRWRPGANFFSGIRANGGEGGRKERAHDRPLCNRPEALLVTKKKNLMI